MRSSHHGVFFARHASHGCATPLAFVLCPLLLYVLYHLFAH